MQFKNIANVAYGNRVELETVRGAEPKPYWEPEDEVNWSIGEISKPIELLTQALSLNGRIKFGAILPEIFIRSGSQSGGYKYLKEIVEHQTQTIYNDGVYRTIETGRTNRTGNTEYVRQGGLIVLERLQICVGSGPSCLNLK